MNSTAADPLPSWNDGPAKQAVLAFVARVTTGRIARLPARWQNALPCSTTTARSGPSTRCRFRQPSPSTNSSGASVTEPTLASDPMVQAALAGDLGKLLAGEHHDGLMQVLALDPCRDDDRRVQCRRRGTGWPRPGTRATAGATTNSPTNRCRNSCGYLRANGFKNFIVSGGGADFMRVWVERVYGIPPEQVVGSTSRTTFELRDERTGADQDPRPPVRQRQGGQAGRHPSVHRPATGGLLREQRRRPRDARSTPRSTTRAPASASSFTTPTLNASTPYDAVSKSTGKLVDSPRGGARTRLDRGGHARAVFCPLQLPTR